MPDRFYNDSPHQPTAIPEPFTQPRWRWAVFLSAAFVIAGGLAVIFLT